mmetsp:Transcript_24480/g.78672  ORF Transcript_24480/g.78672 Transcript_24480/m.78672 type:complete len:194 (+) Transcript_24480:81-662(+)
MEQTTSCHTCVSSATRRPSSPKCGTGAEACLRSDRRAASWPQDEACAVFETGRSSIGTPCGDGSSAPHERRRRPQKRPRSCLKTCADEVCAGQAKKRVSWNRERFLEVRLFCTSDCPAHAAYMEYSNSDDDTDESDYSSEGEEDVYELPGASGLIWAQGSDAEEDQWCDLEIDAAALLARLSYAHDFGCSIEV